MILSICPNPSVDKYIYLKNFRLNSVNKSQKEVAYPGGKGVHVALALNELKHTTRLVGFWGGPTGKWIKDQCINYGIETIGPEVNGWTRTCTTFKTDGIYDDTEVTEKGPFISIDEENAFFQIISREVKTSNAIVVSGSWPSNSSVDNYLKLKKNALEQDIPLWIDASEKNLKSALLVNPFGIHINTSEAKSVFGKKNTAADYVTEALKYCDIAAISDGANGLFLGHKDTVIHAKYTLDKVISTVGSGDCLTAGVIAAWAKFKDLIAAAKLGVACGAANCLRKDLGMLHNKDAYLINEQVSIQIDKS